MQIKISKWDYLPCGTYELIETNGKLAQAIKNAGFGSTPRQILIEHDKLGGLIRDDTGTPMLVHAFWNIEKVKVVERQKRKEKWNKITEVLMIIGKYVLLPLFIAYLIYKFGWNK